VKAKSTIAQVVGSGSVEAKSYVTTCPVSTVTVRMKVVSSPSLPQLSWV
jgi:hypothetical protein